MAEGPPKRRPKGSPYAVLAGDLSLSPEQRRAFEDSVAGAFGEPFWITTGEGRKLGAFRGEPTTQGDTRRVPRAACRVPRAACRVPRAACRVPLYVLPGTAP
jgi:hypothetical protein